MKVYLTELAYRQILLEVKKYKGIETGAILIGRIINNDFFVFESLDSGINCQRSSAIFHRDNPYSEHLADVVRSKYEKAYAIGFWHRHPGNFAQFSSADLTANINMAKTLKREIISGLINVYNDNISFKVWKISLNNEYEDGKIVVGDQYFKGVLQLKDTLSIEREILSNEKGLFTNPVSLHKEIRNSVNECKRKKGVFSFLTRLFRLEKKQTLQEIASDQEDIIVKNILTQINSDISYLKQEGIICQQYITQEHKDKLFLSFNQSITNSSCDVCLYFDKNRQLVFFLDKLYKYESHSFIASILHKLKGA